MVLAITGMLIPMVIVPTALGLKYARYQRELEHTERMQALQMGRTLPKDEPWWSPARTAIAIGAGVPISVFALAWLACESLGNQPGIWISAMFVGMTAVAGGVALAVRDLAHRERVMGIAPELHAKPLIDEDAYDVVSRRG